MSRRTVLGAALAAVLIAVVVTACTQSTPSKDAGVAFTSPADGTTIVGSREVVVTLTLTNATNDAAIDVETTATVLSQTRSDTDLEVKLELASNENTITVSVANPGQAVPGTATLALHYPFLSLTANQAAAVVIGQPDFDSASESDPTKEFGAPYGRPLVLDGVLYLPDYGNQRVMGYMGMPTTNGAAADFVLGKQDFDDTASPVDAAGFKGPQTVAEYQGKLYVIDYSFNRILVFDPPPVTSGAAAAHVIGQPDFYSSGSGTSSTRFRSPESMFITQDGKLLVADSGNDRVLIWNAVPTTVDTPADLVLGQPDMDSDVSAPTAANTMEYPVDVWSDGERVVVVDPGNNRVLVWNTFPTEDFADADVVLGQADFVSSAPGSGAGDVSGPGSVYSNGNQLFVADSDNNRVLVWNSFPSVSGQPADVAIGQEDLDSFVEGTSATGLTLPTGVYVFGDDMFVTDKDNYRYLVYHGTNE